MIKDILRAGAAAAAAALLAFSGITVYAGAGTARDSGRIFQAAAGNEVSDDGEQLYAQPETETEALPEELAGEAPEEEYRFDEEKAGRTVFGWTSKEDGTVSISLEGFYRSGSEEEFEVPGEIEGKTVTAIDDEAFCRGNTCIVKVILPDSLTVIGDGAFAGCTGLKEIVLPDGLTRIGKDAFAGCSSLESLTLPASVSEIGEGAFAGCSALTLSGGNDNWQIDDGVLYHGSELWYVSPSREDKLLRVKDGTTRIAARAAEGNIFLRSVSFPDSLTEIGERAFAGCENLTSPVIPGSVSVIGDLAFSGCISLQQAVLPSELKTLGSGAFAGCSVPEFILKGESSQFSVEDGVLFSKEGKILYAYPPAAGRAVYKVPDTVTMIARGAFYGTDPRRVLLPDTLTLIEEDAFREAVNLQRIRIPKQVGLIGKNAFCGCTALKKISWDALTEVVSEGMFAGCTSLSEVHLPVGIDSIDDGAFAGCTALETVYLPASLERVGMLAFAGCTALKSLRLPLELKYIDDSAFGDPRKQPIILKVAGSSSQERWARRHGFRYLSYAKSMYEHYVREEQPSGWDSLNERQKRKEYEKNEIITQVQIILNGAGYTCGNADGVAGARTKEAIRSFRADRFMTESDEIDEELLRSMGIEPTREALREAGVD